MIWSFFFEIAGNKISWSLVATVTTDFKSETISVNRSWSSIDLKNATALPPHFSILVVHLNSSVFLSFFCLSAFLPFCLSAFLPFCFSVLEHLQVLTTFIIAKGFKATQSPQTVPSRSFPQHCAYFLHSCRDLKKGPQLSENVMWERMKFFTLT